LWLRTCDNRRRFSRVIANDHFLHGGILMPYTVTKVEMWTGEIEDRVGGLGAKLEAIAQAGTDLEVVVARRQPHQRGKGVVFLGPIKGTKAQKAASAAGLARAPNLYALRVEGPNKAGDCAHMTRLLADAGINLRGLTATVCGGKYVLSLGFDSADAAGQAARILSRGGGKRK
jgi:hypothetical protein